MDSADADADADASPADDFDARLDAGARVPLYRMLWRALDPVEILTELTSGLTITLVILLTAGVVMQDADRPVRLLLVLAVSSTLAAGLSAGILNSLEDLHEEGDKDSLRSRLRTAAPEEANALIEERIEDVLGTDLDAADVARVAAAVLDEASGAPAAPPTRHHLAHLRTAAASVVYNLVALLPAALPFLLFDDWHTAWRWSSVLVAAALVVVGILWGRATRVPPIVCGLVLMSIGLVEIAVAFVFDAL